MHKILIIDDHAQTRQLIKWALADSGYGLHEASTGEVGLQNAEALKPALILLDILMPGELDGFQVCEKLRSSSDMAGVKIVMLSANDSPKDRERGQQVGANAYLAKPFKPAALRAIVTALLAG